MIPIGSRNQMTQLKLSLSTRVHFSTDALDWGVLDDKRTRQKTNIKDPNGISFLPVSYCVIIVSVPWLM
jgi:hypothetical protein